MGNRTFRKKWLACGEDLGTSMLKLEWAEDEISDESSLRLQDRLRGLIRMAWGNWVFGVWDRKLIQDYFWAKKYHLWLCVSIVLRIDYIRIIGLTGKQHRTQAWGIIGPCSIKAHKLSVFNCGKSIFSFERQSLKQKWGLRGITKIWLSPKGHHGKCRVLMWMSYDIWTNNYSRMI